MADGLIARSGRGRGDADEKPEAGTVAAGEPLPEWERDLYEGAEKKAAEPSPPRPPLPPSRLPAEPLAAEAVAAAGCRRRSSSPLPSRLPRAPPPSRYAASRRTSRESHG